MRFLGAGLTPNGQKCSSTLRGLDRYEYGNEGQPRTCQCKVPANQVCGGRGLGGVKSSETSNAAVSVQSVSVAAAGLLVRWFATAGRPGRCKPLMRGKFFNI